MKTYIVLAILAAAVSHAEAASLTGPLTPAATGKIECYVPNTTAKSCTSISAYKVDDKGVVQNAAAILLSNEPVVTMEIISPVEIKDGKVCGRMRISDLDRARFAVNGQALTSQQSAELRQNLKLALKDMLEHEACTTYTPNGVGFTTRATLDGKPVPDGEQRMIWVSPGEGYKVAPSR